MQHYKSLLIDDENQKQEKDVAVDIDFSNMKGYVPDKVKLFLELHRLYHLRKADVQKSKEHVTNLMGSVEKGVNNSEQQMNQIVQDIRLQLEIINQHTTTMTKLFEQMNSELSKLGVEEFVENKILDYVRYTGFLSKGRRDVYGKYTWTDSNFFGHVYQGEVKNEKREGMAYYDWNNSFKYYGQFKDGVRNGKGTYCSSDGSKYVGEWNNDMKDGNGVLIYENKDRYEGQWKLGKRHGSGIFTTANGVVFKGNWIGGKFTLENLNDE